MSRTPTRPVQVRLPEAVADLLTELARESGGSKTEVVIEALECLRRQRLERLMEEGYREIGDEMVERVKAGLAAALAAIPD